MLERKIFINIHCSGGTQTFFDKEGVVSYLQHSWPRSSPLKISHKIHEMSPTGIFYRCVFSFSFFLSLSELRLLDLHQLHYSCFTITDSFISCSATSWPLTSNRIHAGVWRGHYNLILFTVSLFPPPPPPTQWICTPCRLSVAADAPSKSRLSSTKYNCITISYERSFLSSVWDWNWLFVIMLEWFICS